MGTQQTDDATADDLTTLYILRLGAGPHAEFFAGWGKLGEETRTTDFFDAVCFPERETPADLILDGKVHDDFTIIPITFSMKQAKVISGMSHCYSGGLS